MNSLTPLKVPHRLLVRKSRNASSSSSSQDEEGGTSCENQTDQEKSVAKRTASLIEVRTVAERRIHICTHFDCLGFEEDVSVPRDLALVRKATPTGRCRCW